MASWRQARATTSRWISLTSTSGVKFSVEIRLHPSSPSVSPCVLSWRHFSVFACVQDAQLAVAATASAVMLDPREEYSASAPRLWAPLKINFLGRYTTTRLRSSSMCINSEHCRMWQRPLMSNVSSPTR